MPNTFETMEGTPGLQPSEAAHVLVLGRGRSPDGMGLDPRSALRVECGAQLFGQYMAEGTGVVVCSGYKTPADKAGKLWTPRQGVAGLDKPGELIASLDASFDASRPRVPYTERERRMQQIFQGRPEGYSMFGMLIGLGVPARRLRAEVDSICTGTNLARAEHEGFFGQGDERPVIIVAQGRKSEKDEIGGHLGRALLCAGKLLRRPFIGVSAPEVSPECIDEDTAEARFASRLVLAGIKSTSQNIVQRVDRRSRYVWAAANVALGGIGLVRRAVNFAASR